MGELGINEKGLLDTGYCHHCSKTTRCMMIVMILSGTMFIMTLGSCASSVYFFTQLKEFRQELNTLGKAHESDGEMGSALQSQQQMDDNSPLITVRFEVIIFADGIFVNLDYLQYLTISCYFLLIV